MIYLDNASTTIDKTKDCKWMEEFNWNSHSVHTLGMEALTAIEWAEEVIKDYIHGRDGELIFTSSGSTANNLAITSGEKIDDVDVLTTEIEHKSILQHTDNLAWNQMKVDQFCRVKELELLQEWHNEERCLASVQLVNNETGIIQPVDYIGNNKPTNCYLHTDAIQALGKIPINVDKLGVDMMSLSAHKINGPKGIGALWVSNKALEEYKFPYLGTQSPELIVRFAEAIRNLKNKDYTRIAILEDEFFGNLSNFEWRLISEFNRVVGLFSICIPGIDSDELVFRLADEQIYISSGSACNSETFNPSHVLKAMGMSDKDAFSTVRISLNEDNTMDEMRTAARTMSNIIKELR